MNLLGIFLYSVQKNSIVVYNDQGFTLCDAKIEPNDIFEDGNTIITVGKNIMEVFVYSKNSDNNHNNKSKLEKKKEINIDNNNNNFNNDNFIINNNNNNDNEITCITLAKGFIICGHYSGLMSIWKPEPEIYLRRLQSEKLHNSTINKILCTQLSDNLNYLISCSSDKTIKVYCMDSNAVTKTQNFGSEVLDIKLVKDFDKKTIFIVSLKGGILKGLNESFDIIFDIPSRFKTNTTRYVIPLANSDSNKNQGNGAINIPQANTNNNNIAKGDLLLITEGKLIDVFTWIKEGSFVVHHKQNYPPKKQNNPFPHYPFYPNNQYYRGGYYN